MKALTKDLTPLERDLTLISNGYDVIALPSATKAPDYARWQNTKATPTLAKDWAKSPKYAKGNRGILTKNTPVIDLDITDSKVNKIITDRVIALLGGTTPIRTGRKPRSAIMCHTNLPFKKIKTGKYKDERGDLHETEILGDGQQFVAFGIHPDTLIPYEWITPNTPLNQHVNDLPLLTCEMAREIIKFSIGVFEIEGFTRVSEITDVANNNTPVESDDWALTVQPNFDETPSNIAKVKLALSYISASGSYDEWRNIVFALKSTQWNCARDIAIAWSVNSDKFTLKAFNNLWNSAKVKR